jgi:hypothetical protein
VPALTRTLGVSPPSQAVALPELGVCSHAALGPDCHARLAHISKPVGNVPESALRATRSAPIGSATKNNSGFTQIVIMAELGAHLSPSINILIPLRRDTEERLRLAFLSYPGYDHRVI